jgi:hypothetical protein
VSREREHEVQNLQGGLKALVTRLTEAELLLVYQWVKKEIEVARNKPALRIVRSPSQELLEQERWDGRSFTEVAGDVRRLVHELPEDSLVALHTWVQEQLDLHYGYRR